MNACHWIESPKDGEGCRDNSISNELSNGVRFLANEGIGTVLGDAAATTESF